MKVFKYGRKSPWVPTLTKLFPKLQANAGSWLGTKNALYYCAQSANSFSWVLFVSSYTTTNVLPHLPGSLTKLVRARETFIFYFSNQKRRNYRWVEKTFGMQEQEQFNLLREYSVFDGSQCIVNIRKFEMWRRRESQISNSSTMQNNNFARVSRFFIHLILCRQLHDYPWKCLISRFVKDVNKQWQNSFSSWTWIWLIEIQLQKSSLAFDKVSELE